MIRSTIEKYWDIEFHRKKRNRLHIILCISFGHGLGKVCVMHLKVAFSLGKCVKIVSYSSKFSELTWNLNQRNLMIFRPYTTFRKYMIRNENPCLIHVLKMQLIC